jgi:CRP-like cAMP-binding protein
MDLIAQGGQTGQLYVLREGQLDVIRDGTLVTTLGSPGSVIGDMSVLLGVPQTATVRAVTEVNYFVIDNALEVLRSHPEWLLQIARLLAQRVNTTTALLTEKEAKDEAIVLPQTFMSGWGDPTV